jgi:hypothetical protein
VPMQCVAVYMPSDDSTAREAVRAYLQTTAAKCRSQGHTMLAGGDWNAAYYGSDRPEGHMTAEDAAHKAASECARLQPCNTATHRAHTWHNDTSSCRTSSRIDDVLMLQHAGGAILHNTKEHSEALITACSRAS